MADMDRLLELKEKAEHWARMTRKLAVASEAGTMAGLVTQQLLDDVWDASVALREVVERE